jgi:serine/threonine protein kinase
VEVSERADPVVIGGRFRVVRRLGEGGFAQVFEVSDQQTGARKALKYLDKLRDSDRSRFKREAFASNTVAQHSGHVLKVHDAEFDGATGVPFITMDVLEGQTLADVVSPPGAPPRPMSLAQARAVLSEVAHALSAAHGCDLVHCDLKPENVFLANTRDADRVAPKVYVLDFGIARLADHHATHHSTAMGTFRWMAPERMSGHASPASDVFSFTLLAAYLLVGRHVAPFDISRTGLVAWAKSQGVSLPPTLDPWFAAGTHLDPHARTQTIAASFRDFEAALAQPQATVAWAHPDAFAPTQAIPSTPRISHAIAPTPSVRHSPVRIVLLTSLGVFALAALGYGGLRLVTADPREEARTPAPAPLVARAQSAAPL